MCLTGRSSSTDSMEIRTRNSIRVRIFPVSLEPSRQRRAQEPIDLQYIRYARPRSSRTMAPPQSPLIEPRPRRSLSSISLSSSPVRSRPLRFGFPFLRRVSRREDETGTSRPRGRGRSPRPFIVDPPRDVQIRSLQRRSSFLRIQSISPRRSRSVETREPEGDTDTPAVDESRTIAIQPIRRIRLPRVRTPSPERERPRRRPTVEIHNDRSTSRGRQRNRSPVVRQVRFAPDVEFNENRARNRSPGPETSGRSQGPAPSTTRRYVHIDRSLCRDRHSSFRRGPSPVVVRRPATARTSPPPRSNRLRPRIIQVGNREIAQQGQSVVEEGRRRRTREGFLHGVSMPWRSSERSRLTRSGSERIVYERSPQQRDGRWQ